MDIIVVNRGRTTRLKLDRRNVLLWVPLALVFSLFSAAVFFIGYASRGEGGVLPERLVADWANEVEAQRIELRKARSAAEEDANALARRIALLQAHVLRLDAAGQRLTEVAGLEQGEFDFSQPPPIGGPEESEIEGSGLSSVLISLDDFEQQLTDRERQLRVLEDLLLASRLQKQTRPSGWPVENGWISSLFGWRSDPFTGRTTMHSGIDFAARAGADVMSAAAGIVSQAGSHAGYGNLVEINHGNGYVTRYGHNSRLLVNVGDRVLKGQRIALVGSTGRSTAPHVHFEVLFNGAVVNPQEYIQAAR
ncbi:MAG TPA: M23 family metallopeptidase [Solimonas sp.]